MFKPLLIAIALSMLIASSTKAQPYQLTGPIEGRDYEVMVPKPVEWRSSQTMTDLQDAMWTAISPYQDIEMEVVTSLACAHKSVLVAAYSLTNVRIIDELIELHRKGVDVQLVLDKSQSCGTKEKYQIQRLQNEHVPMTIGTSKQNHIMHLKVMVIDADTVIDGSWNFSASANLEDNDVNIITSESRAKLFTTYIKRIAEDMHKGK